MSKGESTRAARSTVPSPPKTKAMSARSISFVSARESSASSIGSWPALRSFSLTVFAASSDASQSEVDEVAVASQRRAKRSEEHTSELQSRFDLVCRLPPEKKKVHEVLQTL